MINVEGIVLPNKPLTNFQLIDAVKKLKIKNFRGVFVFYNSERVQFGNTSYCGYLCLYVLKKLQEGVDFQSVLNTLW